MSGLDEGYEGVSVGPPAPWGLRSLGQGQGLKSPPKEPNLSDMAAIEARVSRIESAAVAAFVFLLIAFASGYLLLSNQQAGQTERISAKLDTLTAQIGEVRTDVAMVKERVPEKRSGD